MLTGDQVPQSGSSPFRSLTLKIGFLAAFLMLVVLTVTSLAFVVFERRDTQQLLSENGRRFALFSADKIYDDYAQFYAQPSASKDDFAVFKERLNETLETNPDLVSLSLVTQNGQVLFDSSELDKGRYSGSARTIEDEQTLYALQQDKTVTASRKIDNQQLNEVVAPLTDIDGEPVAVRYLFSYRELTQQTQAILGRTGIVAALLMVFVVVTALLLSRRLANPVIQLTRVTEHIRLGNFTLKAEENRGDEIGRLGRAINSMAASLRSYYLDLEQKVRDRTRELEATQTQLIENVKQDEALLASIGDGVIATDQSGFVVWVNKVAEDMLKMPKEQMVGRQFNTVWQLETEKGEPLKDDEQPLYQATSTGKTIRNSNYYYVRKDAEGKAIVRFAVAITIAPVVLNNQVIGIISVFRDVTHERKVDRMKTEFISLASHQLRTPLSAIRWFTEMLLSGDAGKLNEDQDEFAKNIYDSVGRMIDLVNSLLNISRIESGRIIVDPKPTDLSELVNGVVNDLKAKTEQKQQTLIVSVHKDLPKVNLDARLIGQVYMNFLTNAIKYTPKGGEISVFVSRKGDELVSQVTDNGYGIPKEQQVRVFEKFFRAENVAKVETDGTGLGLYLVKAIIESSGGRVWFESEEGKGTTFWFTLPMSGMQPKQGEVTLDA